MERAINAPMVPVFCTELMAFSQETDLLSLKRETKYRICACRPKAPHPGAP